MLSYGCLSITKWVKKVKADIALQLLIGFWKIPSVGSHYDLINRILGVALHMNDRSKQTPQEAQESPNRDRNRLTRKLEQIF